MDPDLKCLHDLAITWLLFYHYTFFGKCDEIPVLHKGLERYKLCLCGSLH